MKYFYTMIMIIATTVLMAFSTNKYVSVILLMDNGDDKQTVSTIYTTLMAAEKVASLMDVELVSADEVNDDLFVFAIKSEEQMDVTMRLFDEEGYELAAHRDLELLDGNNYNALNVKSLSDGTYIFQLENSIGEQITKTIKIKH